MQFIPNHVKANRRDPIQYHEIEAASVPGLVFMTQAIFFYLFESQSLYLEHGNKNTVQNYRVLETPSEVECAKTRGPVPGS